MNVERFLAHHGITERPFEAEEARHDAVFERMIDHSPCHPDFSKVLGDLTPPSTAIVFGEKGSGKTAIRLQIDHRVAAHNRSHPSQRILLVPYDDLNPLLDRVIERRRRKVVRDASIDDLLKRFRLVDHQDAILSLAVTALVDRLVEKRSDDGDAPADLDASIKRMPRRARVDLAVLAALYDQPRSGGLLARWRRARGRLRTGWVPPVSMTSLGAAVLAVGAATLLILSLFGEAATLYRVGAASVAALALLLVIFWIWDRVGLWFRCRRICRDLVSVERTNAQLRRMMLDLRRSDLSSQVWPHGGEDGSNSRYELTSSLLDGLEHLGYCGIMVIVDRVDEPTSVSGQPERMRAIIWPMLDNKFLQQSRFGFKLLLPIELRHQLFRESSTFFQEARLDKQSMIERLSWSGATLYDLCTSRLRACSARDDDDDLTLNDLFEQDVSRVMIIDALDQMQQPRDAFKFLYNVIQEHCRMVPSDDENYRISRITLDTVRRAQAQRVQELHRGLAPA
ncbi:MAG: hypothetical protein CMJ18_12695 [Phycisphaeraceae bacterium]|nr:hypothetical protein [Phycisphaeraceae bacterium]